VLSPPLAYRLAALLAAALLTVSTAAQATGPRYHTVVNGDTLWSIAHRYHVTAPELADRNHLAPPFALRRGMRLRLPSRAVIPVGDVGPLVRPPPAARPSPPAVPAAAARPPVEHGNHRPGGRWGRPARPGVVHLVRIADHASITLDLRRIGPVTRQRARAFLRSSSGETYPIDPRLLRQLALFSDHFGGRTLEVVSGFRPRRRRQWTAHSKHNTGHAIDFRVAGVPNRIARDFCRTLPATGCGFYPRSVFIHMDTRDASAYWVDWSRPGERPRYGSESHPPPEPRRSQGEHPAAIPDPSVPPVGAEAELDDVADDTPAVRTAQPPASELSEAPDPHALPHGAAPGSATPAP
jgi:LysM repeat protein